jgi:hypothetical protein
MTDSTQTSCCFRKMPKANANDIDENKVLGSGGMTAVPETTDDETIAGTRRSTSGHGMLFTGARRHWRSCQRSTISMFLMPVAVTAGTPNGSSAMGLARSRYRPQRRNGALHRRVECRADRSPLVGKLATTTAYERHRPPSAAVLRKERRSQARKSGLPDLRINDAQPGEPWLRGKASAPRLPKHRVFLSRRIRL